MVNAGLVLEGGGLKGQYTAGVLDSFLEKNLEFPYVVGVSAGAAIGSSFISKQIGRNQEIIARYRRDRRYLSLANLVTTGSLFGMDFIFRRIPHELVPFDFAAFHASASRFVTVVTDMDDGRAVYFEKDTDDILAVLQATAAMPFVSRPIPYQGRLYMDGAVADSIPLVRSEAEGYRNNVVILTKPRGYRKKKHSLSALTQVVYRRHPAFAEAYMNRWKMYNQTMDLVESREEAGTITVIRPSADLKVGRTEKSVEKLEALYQLGRQDGRLAAEELIREKKFSGS